MKASWFASFLAGGAASAALVIACSDDSPGSADAAVCDCPAAEAPLAGRITRVTNTTAVEGLEFITLDAACPAGATILGGNCKQEGTGDEDVYVFTGGTTADGTGFHCGWQNNNPDAINVIVEVTCLTQAP
jgi:hypothetical protein